MKNPMITPQEAEQQIAEHLPAFPDIEVPLEEAHNQILRETVTADRDLPPYDRITMDGVAIHFDAWQSGRRAFVMEETAAAGREAPSLADPEGGCVQVMTGAMLPGGANTVIPYEDLDMDGKNVTIRSDAQIAPLQNLHSKGSDRQQGQPVLGKGTLLRGPHISVAAAVGRPTLRVAARPSVAIVSTGDELKNVEDPVEPYQIRSANDRGIRAALLNGGYGKVDAFRVEDDLSKTEILLNRLLREYGVLILTGGVSMGKRDFVPKALTQLGVTNIFHKIRQKPGKPMWFGLSRDNQPVFALPGNTVSTLICLHRYVLPRLDRAMGAEPAAVIYVRLKEAVRFQPPLTGFIPVRLHWETDGTCHALPLETNTSGDFASLSASDGFIELPEGQDVFQAGQAVKYVAWK